MLALNVLFIEKRCDTPSTPFDNTMFHLLVVHGLNVGHILEVFGGLRAVNRSIPNHY